MDKNTFNKYGWIVVSVIIISILVAVAGPASNFLKSNFVGTTNEFGNHLDDSLNRTPPYTVKLNTNIAEAGHVSFTGDNSGTEVTLEKKDKVTFSVTVEDGYKFLGWYVGDKLISTDTEIEYPVNKEINITAKFEEFLVAGLYETGTKKMIYSWDQLIESGIIDSTGKIISGQEGNLTGDLVIPKILTKIPSYAYQNCTSLTKVSCEEETQMSSIEQYAFNGCTSLTGVSFPNGTVSVGSQSFQNCENLVYFDGTASYVSGFAFKNCQKLITINISNEGSIGTSAFNGCASLASINLPNKMTSIKLSTFSGCTNLTEINIPDSVTTIEDNAFGNCTNLKKVTFGENSKLQKFVGSSYKSSANYGAFYNCISLTDIEIPKTVTMIGLGTFYGCESLESIVIPAGVTNINYTAATSEIESGGTFGNCTNLKSVIFEEGIQLSTIGYGTFSGCSALKNIDIPSSVKTIKPFAFSNSGLESVSIPSGVNFPNASGLYVGNKAFSSCKNLKTINFFGESDRATLFGEYLFLGCTSLEVIDIPDNVDIIDSGVFKDCTSLKKVNFGENSALRYFYSRTNSDGKSYGAFYGCASLEEFTIPYGITKIPERLFSVCTSLKSLTIPATIVSIEGSSSSSPFADCSNLKSVYYEGSLEQWCQISFSTSPCVNGSDLYIQGEKIVNLVFPETTTIIRGRSFEGCTSLVSVVIPEGITTTNNYTFKNCPNLVSVTLPEILTSIGSYAFSDCSSLMEFNIPASVTSIGGHAFDNSSSLTKITFAEGTQLSSLGSYAFDCCFVLKTIDFGGTTDQWKGISKGSSWYNLTPNNLLIYCSDGTVTKTGTITPYP